MIGRVTSQTIFSDNARNLQTAIANLSAAQNTATTQSKLNLPSDDPSAVASALQVRGALKAVDQYGRNTSDANGWLTSADNALSQTYSMLKTVRDSVIQGANGSMSQSARNDIATQLQSIRDALLGQANTTYLGRSIFAGSSDAPQAFSTAGYTFNGAAGSSVNRRVGDGQSVRVDVDGSAVYGNGAASMFSDLDTIINDLRTSGNLTADIGLVDARMQAVSTAQSQVGTQLSAVQNAQTANASQLTLLQGKKSDLEDVDTGQSILNLTMMNNVYTASLMVTAKSLQTSLMDFLR